jgi:hypothetical protein
MISEMIYNIIIIGLIIEMFSCILCLIILLYYIIFKNIIDFEFKKKLLVYNGKKYSYYKSKGSIIKEFNQ